MNSQSKICKGKAVPSASKRFSSNDTNSVSSKTCQQHVPSLRCHEERMINKLSTKHNDACMCQGDGDDCALRYLDHNKDTFKNKKKSKASHRASGSHATDMQSLVSEKENYRKKSKSLSQLQKRNLEDSIDYYPVKLSSENCLAKQQKEGKTNNDKTLISGSRKLTWDQLLRGESEVKQRTSTNKYKDAVSSLKGNSYTNLLDIVSKKIKDSGSIGSSKKNCGLSQEQNFHNGVINYCPFQTLDIIIQQLRENLLKQPDNNNLQKMIVQMEHALQQISLDQREYYIAYQEHNNCLNNPNAASRQVLSDASNTKGKNSNLDELRKRLEESCTYLQSLCIQQKETCNDHLREKEQLSLQLAESRRLLAVAKSKEKDYEVTIGELRLKIQEANSRNDHQFHSEKDLLDTVARLKSEIQTLSCFKEAYNKLKSRLKEISKEKEVLRSKLYMKDLEIEKLKVLLEVKENLNPTFNYSKKENGAQNEENGIINMEKELELHLPDVDLDDTLTSIALRESWDGDKPGLACSSQTSGSIRLSPTPYNSWQHISSIYHRPSSALHLNQDIADIFQSLKVKTEQIPPPQLDLEMPSSASSFWSEKGEPHVNGQKPSS